MYLRFVSCLPISDQCRPPMASPSQYIESEVPGVHQIQCQSRCTGWTSKARKENQEPHHYKLPTVAANTTVHHHQPPTPGQFFDSTHSKGDASNTPRAFLSIRLSQDQSFRLHPRTSRSKQILVQLLSPCRCLKRHLQRGPKSNPGYQQNLAVPLSAIRN